jgi:prepilin-type N-terminal cleavage/methylation domain-containing protein
MSRRSAGFTLIELLAALSVSGLVMLGGVLLVDQVTDSSARIVRSGTLAARGANGLRILRQLFLDARVSMDTLDRFRGDERSVELTTMCQGSRGWLERCRALLDIDWQADSSVIVAHLSTGEVLELARARDAVSLRYLDPLSTDSLWRGRWAPSIAMPAAIGIVSARDTSMFSLGPSR